MKLAKCQKNENYGFTIVELLVVIVVIAVLAAITIVSYRGITQQAQNAKIKSDLETLSKAIQMARINTSETLMEITGSGWTASNCANLASGTDLATLPKTDACWTSYQNVLDKISDASGLNIRNMVDPWGRPYYVDENEGEASATDCRLDSLGLYSYPFTTGGLSYAMVVPLSGYTGCT